MAPQRLKRPTRHAVAPERYIVQHVLVEGAAHRVQEVQPALRPRRSEPTEAIVAEQDSITVAALLADRGSACHRPMTGGAA